VLIHVEVQNQPESNFAERMFCYYYRIRDRYSRQVASFAVLGDDQPSWRPQQFTDELFDCQVDFRFPIVKLLDYQSQWDQLEASENVFAIVVMAHLKTLETRHNGRERQRWKFALIRGLYQRGFEAEEVISLLHFIDWLMNLPEELNQQLWQQVHLLEEEQRMQYMTSFERRAKQEGIEQGLEQGVRRGKIELVGQLLSERLGSLDAQRLSRLDQLSSSQLDGLARQLFQFQSLDDLDGWFDSLDS
jgi:predicted transposase/invertase (TIGR01784 family)